MTRISRRGLLMMTGLTGALALLMAVGTVMSEDGVEAAPVEPSTGIAVARYSLTIDGKEIASFSNLESLTSAVEVEERRDRTRIGAKSATAVLRREATNSLELWAWHEAVLTEGLAARRTASLTAYSVEGIPVAMWNLTDAWPVKVELGALAAGSTETLMETATIVCERIQRVAR